MLLLGGRKVNGGKLRQLSKANHYNIINNSYGASALYISLACEDILKLQHFTIPAQLPKILYYTAITLTFLLKHKERFHSIVSLVGLS